MAIIRKVTRAAASVSGETLIENIVSDLYNLAKQAAGNKIKIWYVKKCVKKLHTHIHKIRQVKTLWQVDKAVDLKEFYCDSHLILNKKRALIRKISDLGDRKRVLITGIAGQGKSILLRYLCSNAFKEAECLPVFIELRRILPGETLLEHISDFLEIIGIPKLEEPLLRTLFQSNKIVLFLDGFDEVAEGDKPRIIRELEHISMTFDTLKIIVTSRPESGLEVSPLFEVIKLSDLQNGEYKQVIKKLSSDSSFADNLIKQVEVHKSKLEDLLCTPLLVTLLVMSYKSFQELPEQLSEFYDSIFQVLLQRHDGVKPGYKRSRRCSFNDNQYRSVFEGLCYESKKDRKSIFAYDDISNFANAALLKNRLESDPDKYVEDIIKVTCLILREGKDYRFIHKSVQEYYSAAFVKHRSEPVAKKFYDQMLVQGPYGRWQQELYFLSEIDKYRYNKFFYLPHLCSILSCKVDNIPDKLPKIELDQAKSLFGSIKIGFGKKTDGQHSCVYLSWNPVFSSKYVDSIFIMNFSEIIEGVEKGKLMPDKTPIQHPPKIEYSEFYILSVEQILNAGFMHSQFIDLSQELINDTFEQARKTQEIILNEETVDMNLNLQLE